MDLTTMQRVKDRLTVGAGNPDFDTLIPQLITSWSQAIEKYLGRHLLRTARVEQYDIEVAQRRVWLKGFPVTAVTEVNNDVDRTFAAVNVVDASNYYVAGEDGELCFDQYTPFHGPGVLRVSYTGGLAVDTAGIIANEPALALACEMQVAYALQRRNQVGITSTSAQGGASTFQKGQPDQPNPFTGQFVPEVQGLLQPYRRLDFGGFGGPG